MGTIYVGNKKVPVEEKLYNKIKLMCDRCIQNKPRRDALLNNEGDEGIGKTTLSLVEAYVVHALTGRQFSEKNVFFDVDKAIRFAQNSEGQIIVFDEPASDVLSAEWWKETQKNLIKLLMIARKKRHFFIFNLTKFFKFSEYIVVDRALGMVHIYNRPNDNQPRFVYIRKKRLQSLYNDYRSKKQRNYKKCASFRGTFPDVLDKDREYNILDMFNVESYEKEKDNAILNIGKKKNSRDKMFLLRMKYKIGQLTYPINNQTELMQKMKIDRGTIASWKKIKPEDFEEKKGEYADEDDENEEFSLEE